MDTCLVPLTSEPRTVLGTGIEPDSKCYLYSNTKVFDESMKECWLGKKSLPNDLISHSGIQLFRE